MGKFHEKRVRARDLEMRGSNQFSQHHVKETSDIYSEDEKICGVLKGPSGVRVTEGIRMAGRCLSFLLLFCFLFFFFVFLGPHPWHMEVPRLGV